MGGKFLGQIRNPIPLTILNNQLHGSKYVEISYKTMSGGGSYRWMGLSESLLGLGQLEMPVTARPAHWRMPKKPQRPTYGDGMP